MNSRFLRDVTLPDGTSVPPGSTVVKVWEVENSGSSKWIAGALLEATRFDFPIDNHACDILPSTPNPKEAVEISVCFKTPSSPGHYRCWWRLKTKEGALFGQHLWVDFQVAIGAPSTSQCPQGHWMQRRHAGPTARLPPAYRGKFPYVNCDACKVIKINRKEGAFHHCPICKYDLCARCSSTRTATATVHTKKKDSKQAQLWTQERVGPRDPSMAGLRPVEGLVAKYAKAGCVKDAHCATDTNFYYYGCCGEADRGWGCTYRVIQMIMSNLSKRKPDTQVPTLRQIQTTLAESKVFPSSHVGSRDWLEPRHAAAYLDHTFDRAEIKTLDGKLNAIKLDQRNWFRSRLVSHFREGGPRTPVMLDNTIQTKAILGIASCASSSDLLVLVFDPHVWSRSADPNSTRFEPAATKQERGDRKKASHGRKWVRWIPFLEVLGDIALGKQFMFLFASGFISLTRGSTDDFTKDNPVIRSRTEGSRQGHDRDGCFKNQQHRRALTPPARLRSNQPGDNKCRNAKAQEGDNIRMTRNEIAHAKALNIHK